jgi:hypothetical protein
MRKKQKNLFAAVRRVVLKRWRHKLFEIESKKGRAWTSRVESGSKDLNFGLGRWRVKIWIPTRLDGLLDADSTAVLKLTNRRNSTGTRPDLPPLRPGRPPPATRSIASAEGRGGIELGRANGAGTRRRRRRRAWWGEGGGGGDVGRRNDSEEKQWWNWAGRIWLSIIHKSGAGSEE